jgi:hypothetical protein
VNSEVVLANISASDGAATGTLGYFSQGGGTVKPGLNVDFSVMATPWTIEGVAEVNRIEWRKDAADASAATETPESVIHVARDRSIQILRADFTPDAALTGNDTDFKTLKIWKRVSGGGSQTAIASISTTATGGTGNWTAFVSETLGTISNAIVAAGSSITFEITKTASGVTVPAGTLSIEWVYV